MFAFKKIALWGAAGLAAFAISCSDDKEEKKYIPVYRTELASSIDLDKNSQVDFTYDNNIITAAEGSYVAPLSAFLENNPDIIAMANYGLPILPDDSISEDFLNEIIDINKFKDIKGTDQAFVDAAGSIDLATDKVFVVLTGGKCFVVAVNLTEQKIVYLNPFETI